MIFSFIYYSKMQEVVVKGLSHFFKANRNPLRDVFSIDKNKQTVF